MGCKIRTEVQSVTANRASNTLPGTDHALSMSIQPGHPDVERDRGQPFHCSKALGPIRVSGK